MRSPSQFSIDSCTQLEPLPYPVYFINKNGDRFQDLYYADALPNDLTQYYERCISGVDVLSAQTYLHLKRRGLNVYLVPQFIPGEICVVARHDLAARDLPFKSYVVACQLDYARPEICHHNIVINELAVHKPTDHFMPLFPHPSLIPRDPSRGTLVETLDYKGEVDTVVKAFRTPKFHQQLTEIGISVKFLTGNQSSPLLKYYYWADYTTSDVIIAVRNLTEYDFSLKPALKLINAWHAGCPALLGPEPAYQAVRKSELDYIEVRSVSDVLTALRRLKSDPGLYRAMVENGFERAKEFSTDRVAVVWRDLLAGEIAAGYERWKQQPAVYRTIGRPIQFVRQLRRHKRRLKEYAYRRDHGVRPLAHLDTDSDTANV